MNVAVSPAVSNADNLQAACEAELQRVLVKHRSVFFVNLASVDGRPYAHATASRAADRQRISALTSSLLGLSESYAKEVAGGRCRYTALAMDEGTVVTVRVPTRSLRFALSVGADDSENLATVLRAALDTATNLARLLG
ncbi:MAG: roadblock/LC7 domain-containing protein [Moraxellaceae bacterium]